MRGILTAEEASCHTVTYTI
ncbi:hypothetical protein VTN00DRAFT_5953 [Thermoascus crustaceus]